MEEFTFPSIPQTLRPTISTTSSSSLWLLATPPPPQPASPSFRRSFSLTALRRSFLPPSPSLSDCGGGPLDEEERMDMLWEDFNEELRAHRWSVRFERDERQSPTLREQRPPLRPLRTSSPAVDASPLRRKKPNLGVMLRVLKKLFVVQGAHNTTTTTTTTTSSSSSSSFKKKRSS